MWVVNLARGGGFRTSSRMAEFLDGDCEKVCGDVSNDYIGTAGCHFRVPIRVPLFWHPIFLKEWGSSAVTNLADRRLTRLGTMSEFPFSTPRSGKIWRALVFVFKRG